MSDPWAEFTPAAQPVPAAANSDPWAEFKSVSPNPVSLNSPPKEFSPTPEATKGLGYDPTDAKNYDPATGMPYDTSTLPPELTPEQAKSKLIDLNEKVAKGVTLGYAPRIAAAYESMPIWSAFGDKVPTYNEVLARRLADDQRVSAEMPDASKVAEFGGGMLLPLGGVSKVAQGVSLGAKAFRGGLLGGAIGGVQASSETPDFTQFSNDDLKRVGVGTISGLAAGGGAPLLAGGVGTAYRALTNALSEPSAGAAAEISAPARDALVRALYADNPDRVMANLDTLGPRAMPLDAGINFEGVGQGLAVKDGEHRALLADALTNRNNTANSTVQNTIDSALGPATSPMVATDALKAQRSLVHDQLPSIFSNAPPVDTSPVLASIGQGLNKAVGPERTVLQKARDFLMEPGPVNPEDAADLQALKERLNMATPSETASLNDEIAALKDKMSERSMVPVTDPQKLSNAKIAIDRMIDYGDPSLGLVPGAVAKAQGAIGDVRRQLNGALRDQVPGYGSTMDASSSLARQIEEIEKGTQTLKDTQTWPSDFANKFVSMPESEQAAHRLGMRSNFELALVNKENDLQAAKTLMQGADGQGGNAQKVATAFGQPAADDVANVINSEQKFRDVKGRILDNSQTAQRTAMAKALADTQWSPKTVNLGDLKNLSLPGMIAAPAQWAANKLVTSLQRAPDNTLRDFQLARAVTTQGDDAKALVRALLDTSQQRSANADAATRLAYVTHLIGGSVAPSVLHASQ